MSTTTFWLRKSIKSKRSWRRRGARGYRSRSWTRRRWLDRGRRSPASLRPTPLARGHRVRIRTDSNEPLCKSTLVYSCVLPPLLWVAWLHIVLDATVDVLVTLVKLLVTCHNACFRTVWGKWIISILLCCSLICQAKQPNANRAKPFCVWSFVCTAVDQNAAVLLFQMDQFRCRTCQIKSWTACRFHKVRTGCHYRIFTLSYVPHTSVTSSGAWTFFFFLKMSSFCTTQKTFRSSVSREAFAQRKMNFLFEWIKKRISWMTAVMGKLQWPRWKSELLRCVIITFGWKRNALLWIHWKFGRIIFSCVVA